MIRILRGHFEMLVTENKKKENKITIFDQPAPMFHRLRIFFIKFMFFANDPSW